MQRKSAHPTLCSRTVNRGWDTSRHPSTFICSLAHKAARYATDASSDIISGVFICAVSLTPPFYFCSLVHKASMFATDASSPQSVLTRSRLKSGYITAFFNFICSLTHKAARYATDANSDIISCAFICEVFSHHRWFALSRIMHRGTQQKSARPSLCSPAVDGVGIHHGIFQLVFALLCIKQQARYATEASLPYSLLSRSRPGFYLALLCTKHDECNRSKLTLFYALQQSNGVGIYHGIFSPKCGWISPRPTSVSEDIVGSVPHSNPNKVNQSLPQQKFVSCVSVCEKHTHITISLSFMHNTAMNSD